MNIPLVNLKRQDESILDEINAAVRRTFEKKDFILGEDVRLFEEEFARFCDVRYGIGVASGTDALHLALRACGVGPGDEVIVPTFTFIATALAVSFTGAKPVFVDIDPDDYVMTPAIFEAAITKKTKAVIPVHLYGLPVSIVEICKIAKKHRIFVIEDACQAHGAQVNGKRTGSFGDFGCFSFYPSKNLGCYGDGGMVITNNSKLAQRVQLLRDYGRTGKYEHEIVGYNCRLDTIQAAILRIKLNKLPQWNDGRRKVAFEYKKHLKALPVILPSEKAYRNSIFHVFAIQVKKRDEVLKTLNAAGIGVGIHYPIPIHLQNAYKNLGFKRGSFPVSEKVSLEILSLPMDPTLSEVEIQGVAEVVKRVL